MALPKAETKHTQKAQKVKSAMTERNVHLWQFLMHTTTYRHLHLTKTHPYTVLRRTKLWQMSQYPPLVSPGNSLELLHSTLKLLN